jgi:hypothetical protein
MTMEQIAHACEGGRWGWLLADAAQLPEQFENRSFERECWGVWLLNTVAKSGDERRDLWVVCEARALEVELGAETLTRLSRERDGKHLRVAVCLVAVGVLFAGGVDYGSTGRTGQVAT